MSEPVFHKRSWLARVGFGFFVAAVLTMLPALGITMWCVCHPTASAYALLVTAPLAYVAIVAFLISVLIRPDRGQVMRFGMMMALYVGLFLLSVAMSMWPA